jgi:hypothetical protein
MRPTATAKILNLLIFLNHERRHVVADLLKTKTTKRANHKRLNENESLKNTTFTKKALN